MQSPFYDHFKANKMSLSITYYTNIFSSHVFKVFKFWPLTLYFSKCGILIFVEKLYVHVIIIINIIIIIIQNIANIKMGLQWDWVLRSIYVNL
jgi:hypothetical protein